MRDAPLSPEDGPDARRSAGVKSARRVIEILELFDRHQEPMSLTELSNHLGYPPSSTLALLKSLQSLDYISYDPGEKKYCPTIRVAMLGEWVQGQIFKEGAVIALMTQLQEETGETVMLAIQNDIFAQYIHTVQSQELLRYYLKPGLLRPICRSAVGLALLSMQPLDRIRKLVKRIEARRTDPADVVPLDVLTAELEEVRARGYAYSDQLTESVSAIAIPLPARSRQPPMALGVGGPTHRLKPRIEHVAITMKRLVSEYCGG
ncbi:MULTISPECIES: IclR family transcriptional regulator [unclassified Xanthobacter]|uniref:IclR family transcriptional regulator n=1 Tax=unclassified Xanthobacter TaxID=2623496 RepID=UPI001EDE3C8A|nr:MULTISPECIES: IclR family transcriptional regulator [unclassified Xanthobacter]